MAVLAETLAMLQRVRDAGHDEIIVAFSGGKDSWATIDLCSRVFAAVHPYFYYLVQGLEIEEIALRAAEYRYGVTISRFPNPCLANMLRSGDYLPRTWKLRRNMRECDYYAVMRKRTGCEWIAFGHRMNESLQRNAMLSGCKGFMADQRKIYPLWDWKAKETFSYLRHNKVLSWVRTEGYDTSAVTLTAPSLRYVREFHPADYARILAAFPFAESILIRDDKRKESGLTTRGERKMA